MKIITAILWCQVVLGLTVAFIAYGDIHSAAMGMEYSRGMQRDFEQLRQSPDYQEPPQVRGYSFARLIEERYSAARERGGAAMLAFISGLGASFLGCVLLWLRGRVQRKA
ncbi:MAG: hypothetical protein H0X66_14720 [Verrucomicrobia bacterium]|nr:hypothetical protein [Verrucomicrobiota bacterium]